MFFYFKLNPSAWELNQVGPVSAKEVGFDSWEINKIEKMSTECRHFVKKSN